MIARLAGRAALALLALLAATAAVGAVGILAGARPWSPASGLLAAGVAAAAWLRPLQTIAALAAILPFFGNRPTTLQYLWLIWLTSLMVLPMLARLLTAARQDAGHVLRAPVGLAAFFYAGASFLSLSSIPFDEIAETHALEAGWHGAWQGMRLLPGMDVLDPLYAVLTVVLMLHALVIALAVAVEVRRDIGSIRWVGGAMLTGLAASLVTGLLDYYQLIDLRPLRSLDLYLNPEGLRLQSTFGHAGWFAQYICFAVPGVLVLRLWPMGPRGRLAAAFGVLLLAFVGVVLSYQRGGWITFLAVLMCIGAAGSRLMNASGAAGAMRTPRAVAAAVVLVVLLGGTAVAGVLLAATEGRGASNRFADRFRHLAQVSDRSAHVLAGIRLGTVYPILGGGSETFAMRYQEEYLRAGGKYYARGYSPLSDRYGSAHNVFAQTFAGKGLVGVLALVALVVAMADAARRLLRAGAAAVPEPRVAAYLVLGGVLAFVLYGMVQEVFYVPALQLQVFMVAGVAAGLSATVQGPARWSRAAVMALLLAALGAHAVQAYVAPGRLGEALRDRQISRAGDRLLPPERDAAGEYFQWTGASAVVTVPRTAVRFAAEFRSIAPFPQTVEIRFDRRVVDRIRLDDHRWHEVRYTAPAGAAWPLPRRVELRVSPTWQPAGEPRTLGVMVRRISWRRPGES